MSNFFFKEHIYGVIKVNCDSNLQIKGWWGLGAICRNEEGLVMVALQQLGNDKEMMKSSSLKLLLCWLR
jgi:hypothetical protein